MATPQTLHDATKLLIPEQPLFVLPSLAKLIGVVPAMFLQQVHYWIKASGKPRDGKNWFYNTLDDWYQQFWFVGKNTVQRTIKALKERGVLLTTAEYNKNPFDRTTWYTIDYEKLNKLTPTKTNPKRADPKKFPNNGENVSPKVGESTSPQNGEMDIPSVGKSLPDTISNIPADTFGETLPRSPDTAHTEIKSEPVKAEPPIQEPLIPESSLADQVPEIKQDPVDLPTLQASKGIRDRPLDSAVFSSKDDIPRARDLPPVPHIGDFIDALAPSGLKDYTGVVLDARPGHVLACFFNPLKDRIQEEWVTNWRLSSRENCPTAPLLEKYAHAELPPVPHDYEALFIATGKGERTRHYKLKDKVSPLCGQRKGSSNLEMRSEGFNGAFRDTQCPTCAAKLAERQAKAAARAEKATAAKKPSAYSNQDLFDAIGAMLGFKDKADVNANGWLIGEIRKQLVTWALEKLNVQDLTKDQIDRLKIRLEGFPEWYAKECKGCDLPGHKLFMKWWTKYAATFNGGHGAIDKVWRLPDGREFRANADGYISVEISPNVWKEVAADDAYWEHFIKQGAWRHEQSKS